MHTSDWRVFGREAEEQEQGCSEQIATALLASGKQQTSYSIFYQGLQGREKGKSVTGTDGNKYTNYNISSFLFFQKELKNILHVSFSEVQTLSLHNLLVKH